MALHEQSVGATDEWYTPAHVFEALGETFDLDVAHPAPPARTHVPTCGYYSDGALEKEWSGFLWMNPPFGARNGLIPWLDKFFAHGNGIALVPDRTSAPWWQQFAPKADAILFVSPKLKFIGADGVPGKARRKERACWRPVIEPLGLCCAQADTGSASPFTPTLGRSTND